jgi:N-acetylglutamate synthase-like GNAT family acetyltransferase
LSFQIRPAKSSEAKFISDLALRSKAYWGYSPAFIEACRHELKYTARDIEKNQFFVAELEGQIIGFFALEIISPTSVELEALFVDPAYINRGYGRKLINSAKSVAKELGCEIMIVQGDPHAKDFYLKAGGKFIGERESASIPGRYLPLFMIALT